jgi:D-alanyl-D-alanine carboxypeptidase
LGGLKTGTTDLAGQNLISYYTVNGKQLGILVLKSEDRFKDTRQLINLINGNLTYSTVE